ncbi:DMT family transporter [Candidatus Peregrinibacteria bacterium]|jgi:drug/metabolite transporter (DMT)-like permease|nr:DMT family transporter [Candidatus Peregrinibacteria bacterium]
MKFSEQRKGELSIISSNFIWAFFPIVVILSYSSLTPLYSAAYSILIAALFFTIIITYKRLWHEFKIKEAWLDIILGSLINGTILYTLMFLGLKYTTAGNASIISLMEIFFAFVIFKIWFKENHSFRKIFGTIIMGIGALIILLPGEMELHIGDLLILSAVFFGPIGNFFQKRACEKVSSYFMMLVRSIIAGTIILILAINLEPSIPYSALKPSIVFLLINGVLFFGIQKIGWLEGIKRIPITKATSFLTMLPAITIIFAFLILGEIPTIWQLLGFIPIATGMLLILKKEHQPI